MPRGIERAGRKARLHHDDRVGERYEDPIAPKVRLVPRPLHGLERPEKRSSPENDVFEELRVRARLRALVSGGKHSPRGSTGIEVYEVEKYTRYAAPITIFILVFMGAIVSSRKSRGGTGLQIALGFLLSFIFILFFTLFRTFAENGSTPPVISVWIPNIIFAIISLIMYKYVPR